MGLMGKARKHLGKLACIAAFVLLLLGGVTAHAAPSNSLTVRVLDEGAPVSGMYVELVTVATEGSGGYVLDDAFTSGPRNMGDLLVDSGTYAAWDLFQYTWASNLAGNVKATSSAGNASYFGLPSGLYLVMERGNQSVTFKPYLIWLPHVVDGTPVYDVVTTPKTANTDTHTI
ncbi:MAG: hypothetical protein IJC51_00275, partial [Eggerthellaceae bacterium]|nr:hypothetical protein [Eggerthellaceae bacterium]